MMKATVVLGWVAMSSALLLACSKDKTPEPATGATPAAAGAAAGPQQGVTVEEVRATLMQDNPAASQTINQLTITSDGNVVTLRGNVEDEETRSNIVNRVRSMPNVRGVRDELMVSPKAATTPSPDVGTTTTTGAEQAQPMTSKSDEVRRSMEQAKPDASSVIHGLVITDDGQAVTLAGVVPDESTRKTLVKAAKDTPGVQSVKDDLRVERKAKKGGEKKQQAPQQ